MIPERVSHLIPSSGQFSATAKQRHDHAPAQAGDDDERHPSSHGQQMQAGCDGRTSRDFADQRRRQAAMATPDERV